MVGKLSSISFRNKTVFLNSDCVGPWKLDILETSFASGFLFLLLNLCMFRCL